MKRLFVLIILLLGPMVHTGAREVCFSGTAPIDDREYEVSVNGRSIPVYPAHSQYNGGVYYYAQFDIDGKSDIRIKTAGSFEKLEVLPRNSGIRMRHNGPQEIAFRASRPFKLVFERDGRLYPLLLFADRPSERPAAAENVTILGPGIHEGVYRLSSGESLYLEEGAVLHGAIEAEGDNITVSGRGIVTGERYRKYKGPSSFAFNARNCRNLKVEGLTFTSAWNWNFVLRSCENVEVEGVKIVCSNIINDDAFDICDSRNVLVHNCFARTQDDVFAIKGYAGKYTCENIRMEDCLVWTDRANIWRIGFECTCAGDVMRNITAKNIDVLHYSENERPIDHFWAKAIFWIQPSNGITIEDCLFEDIRIHASYNDTILLEAVPSLTSGPIPGKGRVKYTGTGSARNITIRNVSVTGDSSVFTGPVRIVPSKGGHTVENIRLKGIRYFGKRQKFPTH